jgi:hypothetical protein
MVRMRTARVVASTGLGRMLGIPLGYHDLVGIIESIVRERATPRCCHWFV